MWLGQPIRDSSIDLPSRLMIGVDGVAAAIDMACRGHGVIGTFENWLKPHLDSGSLLPVLPDWWPAFEGPRLYFSSRSMTAPLRAFIDVVASQRRRSIGHRVTR